jgi:cytochrome P450
VNALAETPSQNPGAAAASPAGPVEPTTPISLPPLEPGRPLPQTLRLGLRPLEFALDARRRHGDVWRLRVISRREPFVVTSHPDHAQSLLQAKPGDAPSITGESPLRPILGPNSVLTSLGDRHLRQRKLLLPPFHGAAVERYVRMIAEVAEREIDSWPVREQFSLAPRMQAVTLEVILRGVLGIEGEPQPGSLEHRIRTTIRRSLAASTNPLYRLIELQNAGRREARGILKGLIGLVDRQIYALIRRRRGGDPSADRHDVLSLLLEARDDEGQALSDQELRDELLSLVLAGHETTANSLAWAFERLLRTPAPYERLRAVTRAGEAARDEADEYVEATIHEAMRARPVVPMIGRMVMRTWRFGEYVVPARTPVAVSIAALHHREDLYSDPHSFKPERFIGRKPGTYTWIPFGGGIRRCLGASLAMAEQRVVLAAIARRVDLAAPDLRPEAPRQRNVTMIPRHGTRVVIEHRHS